MIVYKTYRGARLDIQFYQAKSTIDFKVEVFNDDSTATDLTIYSIVLFKLFHKIHGTLLLTLEETDGAVFRASPADNDIYLDLSHVQTNLRTKEYWYEVYGIREDDEQELIFFGIGDMI